MVKTIKYKGIVEGLLFASGDEGITSNQIAKVLEVAEETVEHLIEELKFDYEHINRGMTIIQSNEVFHLTTKPEHNDYYKKLLQNPRSTRMSQATLETLAIIAYKQPITRVEIEEIRGVNSDYAVQTLLARSLIESVGRKEGIGRPVLFGTTAEFLTYFGLSSIEELPPLSSEFDPSIIEKEADLFFQREEK
ncbi:SMC-Scp complex subunit ScpB [Pseudogracilibacillus sp. SE30717A]|uniref:SMC-Scp complex subunit ScpB n=1 Tax=Pseudogracilibacillus sp. SE30717A TaxID=3098293 RepID=UPI00300E0F4E